MYGDLASAFQTTVAQQRAAAERIKAMRQIEVAKDNLPEGMTTEDTPQQRRLYAEAAMAATLAMGLASSTGDKATMLDLNDPRNYDYLVAAVQANPAYDAASVQHRNATHIVATPEMQKAQKLGRSWHKLPRAYSSFFNVTGQDGMDVPREEEVFVASNGVRVN